MDQLTILGIDPGSRTTGFGVITMDNSRARYVASGCIDVAALTFADRLKTIFAELSAITGRYQPDQVAIEKVFMNQNPESALKLGQARGAAIVACATHDVPVFEYTATQIKQALVGRGHADKTQIQHMVKALLGVDESRSDAADALAAAVCHGHTADGLRARNIGIRRRTGRATAR